MECYLELEPEEASMITQVIKDFFKETKCNIRSCLSFKDYQKKTDIDIFAIDIDKEKDYANITKQVILSNRYVFILFVSSDSLK